MKQFFLTHNKRIVSLLSILIIILLVFTLNINSYAADDQQSEIVLYGFGDNYEDDDFLTLYNTKTCYVSIRNIPLSEKENIVLTVKDENIAEIQEMIYVEDFDPVIIAKIKGKKLGTTDIIASITYNGSNYTSKITTTVHETNYRLYLHREDYKDLENTSIKKNESLKLVATLVAGMATHVGDISSNGAIWSSNNENVASVDNNGLVTGVGKGTATITVKYKTNEGVTIFDSCNIEVKDENSSKPTSPSNLDFPTTNSDPTTAPTILPNTGKCTILLLSIVCIIFLSVTIIMYKKHKNNKDI